MLFMKARATDPRVTFAELQEWPDDGRRYELYDGEVIVVPGPIPRHQRVAANVAEVLKHYERATGGLVFSAPLDIVLAAEYRFTDAAGSLDRRGPRVPAMNQIHALRTTFCLVVR